MKYKDIKTESDFFNIFIKDLVKNLNDESSLSTIFRGHSNSNFELASNFHRQDYKIMKKINPSYKSFNNELLLNDLMIAQYESGLLSSFLQTLNNCDYELPELSFKINLYNSRTYMKHFYGSTPEDYHKTLNKIIHPNKKFLVLFMLAQHHGVPTSFLDWTKSYLIALYFSVLDNDDKDFCVWSLDIDGKFISDIVDPEGTDEIEPKYHEYGILRVVNPPYHLSPNLRAQRGMFTYIEHKPTNKRKSIHNLEQRIDCEDKLIKYTFNNKLKPFIQKYLAVNNIHHGTVFPGLDNAVIHFKNTLSNSDWGGDLFKD